MSLWSHCFYTPVCEHIKYLKINYIYGSLLSNHLGNLWGFFVLFFVFVKLTTDSGVHLHFPTWSWQGKKVLHKVAWDLAGWGWKEHCDFSNRCGWFETWSCKIKSRCSLSEFGCRSRCNWFLSVVENRQSTSHVGKQVAYTEAFTSDVMWCLRPQK